MKFTQALLISTILFSCNIPKDSNFFLPILYSFPHEQIGEGKTFTYVDQSDGAKSYRDIYYQDNDPTKYLIFKLYSQSGTDDSIIYRGHKLIETYSFLFSRMKPVKAKIIQDTVVSNGRKLGKRILKVDFHTDSTILTIIAESFFVKDTSFSWKGNKIPTMIIKTTYDNRISKLNSDIHADFKLEFLTYEAQKIGTVRISIPKTKNSQTKIIDLVEIKDRQP